MLYYKKMNKYMHETNENQVAYRFFVFNIRVDLISEGAKVTELRRYILNFIGYFMCLNLPNVTHLSLRIVVFCIFKR